jgi:hypothetical protein
MQQANTVPTPRIHQSNPRTHSLPQSIRKRYPLSPSRYITIVNPNPYTPPTTSLKNRHACTNIPRPSSLRSPPASASWSASSFTLYMYSAGSLCHSSSGTLLTWTEVMSNAISGVCSSLMTLEVTKNRIHVERYLTLEEGRLISDRGGDSDRMSYRRELGLVVSRRQPGCDSGRGRSVLS